MKRLLSLLLPLLFLAGCAPKVEQFGVEYEAITPREREALIYLARKTLAHNVKNGVIRPAEARAAAKREPDFNVNYSGDRQGKVTVAWRFPDRRIVIHFDGRLMEPDMQCSMRITDIPPDWPMSAQELRKRQSRTPAPRKDRKYVDIVSK